MNGSHGVVAFAFGSPSDFYTNRWIATMAARASSLSLGVIYTQRDVKIDSNSSFPPSAITYDVTYAEQRKDKPPSTLRIARGAVGWAEERGIDRLWVAAAKPHLGRCLRDLHYAAEEAGAGITIRACKDLERYPYDLWFHPHANQLRTRWVRVWEVREGILQRMPMWLYRVATG